MRSANSVEKMQVFCAWSSFRMSACTVPRTLRQCLGAQARVVSAPSTPSSTSLRPLDAQQPEAAAVVTRRAARRDMPAASMPARASAASACRPIVPCARRWRSTRWSMAVFMNMARIIGAGPLMVMDTEVDGVAEVEARIQLLHVVERRDGHAGIAGAAEDVGPRVRVFAVQRGGVEGRRQARGLVARRQVVKAAIGALRRAFAREHARRILLLAPIGIDAAGVRIGARQVLVLQEAQDLAPAVEPRRGELGNRVVAQRLANSCRPRTSRPRTRVGILGRADALHALRPVRAARPRLRRRCRRSARL